MEAGEHTKKQEIMEFDLDCVSLRRESIESGGKFADDAVISSIPLRDDGNTSPREVGKKMFETQK